VTTRDAAWFTDSFDDVLYKIPIGRDERLGAPVAVPLTGSYRHGAGFNLNGIEATAGDPLAYRRAVQHRHPLSNRPGDGPDHGHRPGWGIAGER
jgi:hypothetical protein